MYNITGDGHVWIRIRRCTGLGLGTRKYWGQMSNHTNGRMGVQTLVIKYDISSVVSLLYSSDSRKYMSPLMSVGILYVPHQALYSNITKINKILADARRKRLIRFTMVNNYDCTVVFIKIIQSHIIPYWIAFDDVFMVLYIWMISLQRKCNVSSCGFAFTCQNIAILLKSMPGDPSVDLRGWFYLEK